MGLFSTQGLTGCQHFDSLDKIAHSTSLVCRLNWYFLPAILYQSPWRELEITLIPKADSVPFHGKGKAKASFWSLFYVFDLSQHSSFNPSRTSDMKKLWKLIHFKDESVLATVLSHRSVSTGWTAIPALSAGNISLKNSTWKTLGLLLLICFGSR